MVCVCYFCMWCVCESSRKMAHLHVTTLELLYKLQTPPARCTHPPCRPHCHSPIVAKCSPFCNTLMCNVVLQTLSFKMRWNRRTNTVYKKCYVSKTVFNNCSPTRRSSSAFQRCTSRCERIVRMIMVMAHCNANTIHFRFRWARFLRDTAFWLFLLLLDDECLFCICNSASGVNHSLCTAEPPARCLPAWVVRICDCTAGRMALWMSLCQLVATIEGVDVDGLRFCFCDSGIGRIGRVNR